MSTEALDLISAVTATVEPPVQNIADILRKYGLDPAKATIHNDCIAAYHGHIDLSHKGLTKIPFEIEKVFGSYSCANNRLRSLQNAPREVVGHFSCSRNKLHSLKESPYRVGGNFDCVENDLITLEGCPEIVGGDFNCRNNPGSSLFKRPPGIAGKFISA